MTGSTSTITWRTLAASDALPLAQTHDGAVRLGDVDPAATHQLTIVFRPETPFAIPCQPMSRAEFASKHCASRTAMEALKAHAEALGITVSRLDPAAHVMVLSGPLSALQAAFRPAKLGRYKANGREFMAREGAIEVPDTVADHLVAVMGFDQRPVARPHFRMITAHAAGASYTPVQVAARYGFPDQTGSGQTIALIELGGGYDDGQMSAYFKNLGITRTGKLTSVGVGGGKNTPGDPNGPDGEVQLDIEVSGAVAPGADLVVYFGTNQGSGFYDAVSAAVHDTTNSIDIISISWGGPESGWSPQDMNAMDQAFQAAAALGITVCAASGDSGADDGTSAKVVDFPASSPHALGCGGTRLPASGAETAWNDGSAGGATGGGYSTHFARPSWQAGNTNKMRGVPDVAGDADPQTGYKVTVDGEDAVIGGTSAVAPLWAALIAKANQSGSSKAGLAAAALYGAPSAFNDITQGNNNGYSATSGWDPVTGLGSPKGAAVVALLAKGTATS